MLSKNRYVTVCLRLVLDQHGKLLRGELIGPTRRERKAFLGKDGLLRALTEWLTGYQS